MNSTVVNMKSRGLTVLATLAAAALAAAVWFQNAKIARLQAECSRLSQELASAQENAPRAGPEQDRKTAADASPLAGAIVANNRKELTPEEKAIRLERRQKLDRKRAEAELADPRKVALITQRIQLDLDIRYGEFFRRLGLGAQQIDKLKSLLVERYMARRETYALSANLSPDARKKLEAQMIAEAEAEIGVQMGAPVLDALREYEANEPYRHRVGAIDRRLAYAAASLDAEQQSRLAAVLRHAPKPPELPRASEAAALGQAYIARLAEYHAGLVQSASDFLSPEQTAAFQKLLQEEARIEELGLGK